MMVSDCRNAGLGNEFSQGYAEGHLHGDGKGVLRHENIDPELFHELVERAFQIVGEIAYSFRYQAATRLRSPNTLVQPNVLGKTKIRFGHDIADVSAAITLAAVPKTNVPVFPEHLGPLGALQRDAVLSREASRYESYVLAHASIVLRM